jgi:hypothetical protein
MKMGKTHLSDDRLIEGCLDVGLRPDEQQHLESCSSCTDRHSRLARVLADAATVAATEADAVFDDARLEKQQARILQRLEHEGRPGRLLAFPANHPHTGSLRARPRTRWIAGAAAAGLLIGVLAGHLAHVLPGAYAIMPADREMSQPLPTLQAVSTTLSEEEFLGLLEVAIERTGGSSLRPLDDLTPSVLEVAAQ